MESPPVLAHGGTRPRPPGELRSPVLREHGAAVAEASFRRIYRTWPELMDRYGERGRQLTAEDNHWHLNFLDAAVALGDPGHFERYAAWLTGFLMVRGLVPEHIAGAFEFLADGLQSAEVAPEHQAHRDELVGLLRQTAAKVRAGTLPY